MNENKKGITPIKITFIAVALLAIIGVGGYYLEHGAPSAGQQGSANIPRPGAVATPTPKPPSFSISPQVGPAGTMVTVIGPGFSASNTVLMSGMTAASLQNIPVKNGNELSFTVPSALGPDCKNSQPCPQYILEVKPHVFTLVVISGARAQTIGSFRVTN